MWCVMCVIGTVYFRMKGWQAGDNMSLQTRNHNFCCRDKIKGCDLFLEDRYLVMVYDNVC